MPSASNRRSSRVILRVVAVLSRLSSEKYHKDKLKYGEGLLFGDLSGE